jgi:glucokinase-like ROK family protein
MHTKEKMPTRIARNISRSEIFKVIRAEGLISRSKLAELVPVSRATVSSVVAELLEAGVLEEVGEGQSTGGRRPVRLQYRPDSKRALGLVLFDNRIQAVLTDMEGNPVSDYLELPIGGANPDAMLDSMKETAKRLLAGVTHQQVLGVGVGVPGIVDFETGVIEISVSKGWLEGGIRVKDYLESELDLPVYVANRSRVAALGEQRAGDCCNVANLIYLFLGQGIAAGIVIDGSLYLGPGSSAGEIGHVSVVPDGPLCACGNHGCLEVYATEAAILARARATAREAPESWMQHATDGQLERLTIDHVIQAARTGDATALAVLGEAGGKVGIAVSTLIDLFNPEVVIIGGPIGSNAGDLLLDPIKKEAQRRTLSRPFNAAKIVNGTLGTKAVAIGAAVLAIDHTPVNAIFGD